MHLRRYYTLLAIGLLGLMLFAATASINAETATTDEMQLAAQNWLNELTFRHGVWAGSANPEISGYEDIMMNDTMIARCFYVSPLGYIIVPVLKDLPPVMACSDEFDFIWSPDDAFGFPALIRDVLENRARLFVQVYGSLETVPSDKGERLLGVRHRQEWDLFLNDETTFMENLTSKAAQPMEEYGPLLTSTWHQDAPYNNDCPVGDGARTVVGCVATAAAQILNYYQWPPEGLGELTYYWYGDNSCGGTSPGQFLSADFNDSYDWANIKNNHSTNDTPEQQAAVAELCYEVGIAFMMDYGACGSGAYTGDAATVFPTYFRYHDWTEIHERSDYGLLAWSDILRGQAEVAQPVQYRIYSHSIVGDGWRQVETLNQIHLNYGWGGSHNAWYTIDEVYCPWEGCSQWVEYAVTNIVPDRGVHFAADTLWGMVPLDVRFTGISDYVVDDWIWDFGDGDSAFIQSPMHTYTLSGRYNVKLEITSGGDKTSYQTLKYITALADTLLISNVMGDPGDTVELVIYARNTVPLQSLRIPLEYPGTLNLNYLSFSTTGCLTDYFDQKKQISFDPYNKRMTFSLLNTSTSTPDLDPGYGPVLKVYFQIPGSATLDQTASIELDGYSAYLPMFFSSVVNYPPVNYGASITLNYLCGDADNSGLINLLDVTYLINFIYKGGPEPMPYAAGDPNASGGCNILDVTYLINYIYKGGPVPLCP